jgi:hypothetical protein
MKISKQDKKEAQYKDFWQRFLLNLDARPSRTASIMAIILLVSFLLGLYEFYQAYNKPNTSPDIKPTKMLIDQVREGLTDTVNIYDKIEEYFFLLDVQKELEEMQRDSTKLDSARIEQLYDLLKMKME